MRKLFKILKESIKGTESNFTSGNINRAILLLSIPMILEMVMEGLFAVVDAYFVSKISNEAFATVIFTETVATLVYSLAIGVSIAGTAMVARRIGEKKPKAASEAAAQAMLLGIGLSILVSIMGIFFPQEILRLMGATEEVVEVGTSFTRILLGFNVVIMLLFILNGVFRGAGDAAIAMRVLWLANILNIILDPLLIFGWGPIPALGLKGAAIATSIGRGTAVAYQLYILFNGKGILQITKKHLQSNWEVLKRLINVAATGSGQYLISSASWIFLMMIISDYGTEVVNGYGLAIRIIIFTILPAWGIANAAATLIGQNLGAGKPDRAEKSVWRSAYYNMLFLLVVSIIYFIWARPLISIFNQDPEVIAVGTLCLKIFSITYVFFGYGMVINQAFGGAGDTRTPTVINFVCFWLIQIPLAYFLAESAGWGPEGVYWAIAISETVLAVMAMILFKRGRWKTVRI